MHVRLLLGTELCALLVAGAAWAAGPEAVATNLAPMVVVAKDIAPTWVYGQTETMGRALAATPAVLLNSQGGYAAQNDLSIRGSSFSGAGLTVGGLSLRNPQTEHFNSELPLPASLLTAPAVLTGLDQAEGADGHLAGSVAFDFAPVREARRLSAGAGEMDRHWETVFVQQPLTAGPDGATVGASAFGAYESADAIDYRDNDLTLWNAGGHVQVGAEDLQADLAAGTQEKEFGARGYYGVSETLPAEETVEDTLVIGSARVGAADGDFTRLTAHWRELDDEYTILPAIFHNQTDSRVLAAAADGRVAEPLPAALSLQWRGGIEDETLDGLTLGDQERQRGFAQLLPGWTAGPLAVTAGARGEVFTDDEPAILPQAGIDLQLCEAAKAYGAYTETVRQPSFTELNYESPGSLGNAGLERQEARTLESGLDTRLGERLRAHAAVFQQWSDQSVDWVKVTDESARFEAVNLDAVDTLGIEAALHGDLTDRLALMGQYTWLDKDSDADVYASRYALDYPEHLVQVSAIWRALDALQFTATQVVRWQVENALRASDDVGTIGAVAAHLSLPQLPNATLTLALDNVWDDDFEVYAGQETAGRRVSGGLTLDW